MVVSGRGGEPRQTPKGGPTMNDTTTAARIAMMRAKIAAESAAYYAEHLTGVRMVRTDGVHYGQETRLMADAVDALRAIPAGERSEVAVAALEALEAWEAARDCASRCATVRARLRAWSRCGRLRIARCPRTTGCRVWWSSRVVRGRGRKWVPPPTCA